MSKKVSPDQIKLGFADKLDTTATAEYVGLEPNTLENWRSQGKANQPPFYRVGRKVYYLRSDLDDWLARNKQAAS